MRKGRQQPPIQIHFMPALACNQHCTFCAYGHRTKDDNDTQENWKNMEMMSEAFLPREKMLECIESWDEMGVKAVEVTGGGEPLIYPHIDEFFQLASAWGVDLSLVTNGTGLTESRADMFNTTNWKWARVSIDAGSLDSYCSTRRVAASHWKHAWDAVSRLAKRKADSEQRVGVSYVVDFGNYADVYEGVKLAKLHGADNVRISAAFTPQQFQRFPPGAVETASLQARAAKEHFEDDTFQVNNLFDERINNILLGEQDYAFCAAKEVICVVGGDMNVYTCCTLAFNPKGLIGSIRDQSFRVLWESDAKQAFFRNHDARTICRVECLYEKRNKRALQLMATPSRELEQMRRVDTSIHRNFV